ncbi:MAG: 6-bladed beta-propeller [Cytophagales bacterium]|nr:MAG: 6-bladed beta-propeller [Cytophagales bacterium]
MKNITISLLSVALFLVVYSSCTSPQTNKNTDQEVVLVDLEKARSFSFDSVFKVEEHFPLVGSEDLPIKRIKRLIKHESTYWLLTTDLILLTDLQGTVMQTIADKGEGPGEFQSLDDIRWNYSSRSIEILDRTSGKIISYSKTGEFQKEWKNRYLYAAQSFYPQGKTYLIYGGTSFDGGGNRLVRVSQETGEILSGYFPLGKEKNYLNVTNHDTFSKLDRSLEFYYSYQDTIYSVEESALRPKYIFDFKEFTTPKSIYDRDFQDILAFELELESRNFASVFFIKTLPEFIFLRVLQSSEFSTILINRNSLNVRVVKHWESGFGPEFEKLSSYFIFSPIASDESFLYFSLDPYAIKSAIEDLKDDPNLSSFLQANPRIREIYEQFDTYENPYILKLSIQEF